MAPSDSTPQSARRTFSGSSRAARNSQIDDSRRARPTQRLGGVVQPSAGIMAQGRQRPSRALRLSRHGQRSGRFPPHGSGPAARPKALESRRYQMWLFTSFGAVALLIATVGVYATTAYGVSRRRRAMNIRVALGARASQVFALVLRQSARSARSPRRLQRVRVCASIRPRRCETSRHAADSGSSLPQAHAGLLGRFSQRSIFAAQHELSSLRQLEIGGVIHG
jgi:hypothetical protein